MSDLKTYAKELQEVEEKIEELLALKESLQIKYWSNAPKDTLVMIKVGGGVDYIRHLSFYVNGEVICYRDGRSSKTAGGDSPSYVERFPINRVNIYRED